MMNKHLFALTCSLACAFARPASAEPDPEPVSQPPPRIDPSLARARRAAVGWLSQLNSRGKRNGSKESLPSFVLNRVSIEALAERALLDAPNLDPADHTRIVQALERRINRELTAQAQSGERLHCALSPPWTAWVDDAEGAWVGFDCRDGRSMFHLDVNMVERMGRWQAVDLEIDEARVSRNLRAQINKQLRLGGVERVIERLDASAEG